MEFEPLGKYIATIFRHQQILINHRLKPYGLGSGTYVFLITIYNNQGISQKELTELVKIDKATTAKGLKKLEQNGFINRVESKKDKRYNELYVSDKGEKFMPTLISNLDDITTTLLEGLSDNAHDETIKNLKVIQKNVLNAVSVLRE